MVCHVSKNEKKIKIKKKLYRIDSVSIFFFIYHYLCTILDILYVYFFLYLPDVAVDCIFPISSLGEFYFSSKNCSFCYGWVDRNAKKVTATTATIFECFNTFIMSNARNKTNLWKRYANTYTLMMIFRTPSLFIFFFYVFSGLLLWLNIPFFSTIRKIIICHDDDNAWCDVHFSDLNFNSFGNGISGLHKIIVR